MTFGILSNVIAENNIPKDVKLMSDSGWECSATEMDAVWYNSKTNTIIFTQGGKYNHFEKYYTDPDWILLFNKEEK